jgi:dGTPase
MSIREQFEQHQRQWLAPCAVHESDSGGRAVAEAEHSYRTCFQRDRDRIMHCSAFRRLSEKTQVFSPDKGDYSRTRLTHTVEVSQISRTLAGALRLNEDVAEAVALAHDLGHPPFGHSGEAALNELMADHGHFEHNRQSLRVVDYLEHPYPNFRGLNLCRVIRECLAKHTSRYDTPVCEEFAPKLLAPLEGQLVDLCDEIAYTSADLEDALAVGWLTLEQLGGLALWRQAWAVAQAESPDARDIHKRIRACKAVLAAMADDLLTTTLGNIAEMNIDSPQAARAAPRKAVALSPAVAPAVREMQDFLMANVYLSGPNADKDRRCRRIVTGLFEAYLKDPTRLPQRYRTRIDADGLHRTICDFIAGMTDRYCLAEHEKLTLL